MSKRAMTFGKQIRMIFRNMSDRRIMDSINIRNIRNVHIFSVIACIVDAVSLLLFVVMNRDSPDFWLTFFNVGCYVAACAVVAVLSKMFIRKYDEDGTISNIKSNILVTFFYILLSVWGILVDVEHYRAGEQMLTFYIVQFCFICFVMMKPKIGSFLIALSFFSLYLSIYFVDGAAGMQPQNYILFTMVAVLGNAIQHMLLLESEKYKIDIIELNQILQQEASFDDLTKLKNRNALHRDFEKHMGKFVYIIMTDIDYFKNYNDTYGHVVGDKVLQMVASATMETFRDGEAYRYGGDEFLIILADCTKEELEEKIEKWKEAIQSIHIPNVTRFITCSYGYEHRLVKNMNDLRNSIKTADDRLYEAKKARDSR